MAKEIPVSDVKQRLLDICATLEISARSFSSSIGMSPTYLTSLNKDITSAVLNNIYINYPNVNILWIITGKGEMLNTDPSLIERKEEVEKLRARIEELKEDVGYWKGKAGVDLKSEPA